MKQKLNDQQLEAAGSFFPKILVLAGAGTGKTTTLTERIRHLIKDREISGASIMAVTFTNKAAREIRERLLDKVPSIDLQKIWLGTFHSICLRILKEAGYRLGYGKKITVYDADDSMEILIRINEQLSTKLKEPTLRKILNEPYNPKVQEKHGMIIREYEYQLKRNNAVDYRKIIEEALAILSEQEDIRESYHRKFLHMLVDEYQDTNKQQYRFIRLIDPENLYAVGDNDQAIYGWRGADIGVILNFQSDYPGAKKVTLEQNYRSAIIILEKANNLIRHNKNRFDKALIPCRKLKGECRVRNLVDPYEEAKAIKAEIADSRMEGYDYGEIAILARTNRICRNIHRILTSMEVPAIFISRTNDIWQSRPGRNILNMLWLLVNPYDDYRAEKYLVDDAKLERGDMRHIKDLALENTSSLLQSYQRFYKIEAGVFPFIETEKLTEATRLILEHLRAYDQRERYPEKWAGFECVWMEIEKFSQKYSDRIDTFLEETTLRSEQDQIDSQMAENKVKLMTMHGAKGLEFPVVFIAGVDSDTCPNKQNDPEEERRLFYVAMTRAKDRLVITRPETLETFNRQIITTMPSPYIREMNETQEGGNIGI